MITHSSAAIDQNRQQGIKVQFDDGDTVTQ